MLYNKYNSILLQKQLKSLGNLSTATEVILEDANNFNYVSDAVKNLGAEYAATALLSSSLTDAEKIQILVNKGLSLEQANMALSTATLSAAQKASTVAIDLNTMSKLGNKAATKAQVSEETKNLLLKGSLVTAEQIQSGATVQLTKDKISSAVASGALTKAEGEQLIATFGLTGATGGLGMAFKGLGVSIANAAKASVTFLAANPLLAFFAGTAALIAIVSAAIDLFTTSTEEARKQAEKSAQELSDLQSEISSINSQLETTSRKIDELLAKDKLELTDEETLKKLQAQNEELERELRIKEALEKQAEKEASDDATKVFTSVPDNGFWEPRGTTVFYQDSRGANIVGTYHNPERDRMQASLDYMEQLVGLNQELTDLEAEYRHSVDGSTKFQVLDNQIKEKKELIGAVQNELNSFISDFQTEDDNLVGGISEDTDIVLAKLDEIYEKYDVLMNYSEGTALTLDKRLKDKFAHGADLADGSTYLSTSNNDKEISAWIDSLTEEEKKILVVAEIDENASLEELKKYLAKTIPDGKHIFNDIFSLKDTGNNATALSNLKDQLSEVESAYQTCLSAKEEYDGQGYLSADTLQKILSLGDEYLQYLFDEEGNVRLDAEAFQQLALSRINCMEAQALSNLAENIQQITDEAAAVEYLTQKQNELARSCNDVAVAKALSEMSSIEGFSSSEKLQSAFNSFQSQYNQIKSLFANTRNGLNTTYSSSYNSDAVKTARDAQQAAKDAQQATKDHIEAYMDYMKKSLEAGRLDYQRYTHDVSGFLKNMYEDGKISAKEYFDYNKLMLEYQKSVMDQVLSAVDLRLEKEIDSYQHQISSIEEYYQSEIDYLDTVIQYYEDQKTALQDANDEIDRQLRLEQALYAFEMAQNQKTKKVYTSGSGFVYKADETAIKDASDDLREAKLDIEIAKLEEAIKQVENQQKTLQDAMNAETAALEDIISNLEAYRDKWTEIAGEYETAQNNLLAAQLLGADWENQIIDSRLETLNKFRDDYLALQQSIVDAAWQSANEQIKAAQEAKKGADGTTSSGTVSDIKGSSKITQRFEVVHMKTGKTVETFDSKKEAKAYVDKLNQRIDKLGTPSSYIIRAKTYHKGLEEGLVGDAFGSEDFRLVQKFGLQDSEVSAVLQKKEAVLTEVQIGNIANALRLIPVSSIIPSMHMPDSHPLTNTNSKYIGQSVIQQVTFNCPNLTDKSGIDYVKKELSGLKLAAYQYSHKRHLF